MIGAQYQPTSQLVVGPAPQPSVGGLHPQSAGHVVASHHSVSPHMSHSLSHMQLAPAAAAAAVQPQSVTILPTATQATYQLAGQPGVGTATVLAPSVAAAPSVVAAAPTHVTFQPSVSAAGAAPGSTLLAVQQPSLLSSTQIPGSTAVAPGGSPLIVQQAATGQTANSLQSLAQAQLVSSTANAIQNALIANQQQQQQQQQLAAALLASGATAGAAGVPPSNSLLHPGAALAGLDPVTSATLNSSTQQQQQAAQQQLMLQQLQVQQQYQQLKRMQQRLPHVSGVELRTLQKQIRDLQQHQQMQSLQTLRLAQKQEQQAFKYLNKAIKSRPSRATYQDLYKVRRQTETSSRYVSTTLTVGRTHFV